MDYKERIENYRLNKNLMSSKLLRDKIILSTSDTIREVAESFTDYWKDHKWDLIHEGYVSAAAVLDSIADNDTSNYIFNVEINARVAMILYLLDQTSSASHDEIESYLAGIKA